MWIAPVFFSACHEQICLHLSIYSSAIDTADGCHLHIFLPCWSRHFSNRCDIVQPSLVWSIQHIMNSDLLWSHCHLTSYAMSWYHTTTGNSTTACVSLNVWIAEKQDKCLNATSSCCLCLVCLNEVCLTCLKQHYSC